MDLSPTTELEAVNTLLLTIGEAPVNTLIGSIAVDASMARQLLHQKSRTLQTKGWAFNRDLDLPLVPMTDGTIPVPNNTLSIDALDRSRRIIIRAGKLYDRAARADTFDGPVRVNITYFLSFDDLPEYARQYITISAGRKFQDATLGEDSLHRFTTQDEIAAWSDFMAAEVEQGDYNILRDSPTTIRTASRMRVPLR